MELVTKRIEAYQADAPYRLTQSPLKRLLLCETTVDERGQDSILGNMGSFSQENIQNMERSG